MNLQLRTRGTAVVSSSLFALWTAASVSLLGAPVAAQAEPGCSVEEAGARRALTQAGRAVVSVAVADLFVRPDKSGPLADQALFGELLTVLPQSESCLDSSGRLVLVETASTYRGYVPIQSLWPLTAPAPTARPGTPAPPGMPGQATTRLRVTARLANLYRSPSVSLGNPLLSLPLHSEVLQVESFSSHWLKVALPDGSLGFLQRGDVEPVPAPQLPTPTCILREARKYDGTPYLWGGRSTLGIDCSGLVANAFQACGVVSPRDARLQAAWSDVVPVSKQAELQPGDLLFFQSESLTLPAKITHVGLYLGHDRFLHASTSERPSVHESTLSDPEWQRRYLTARRYRTFL